MFTGLIREIGTLRRLVPGRESTTLDIAAPRTAGDLASGDSLAVDGICLTVTATRGEVVTVQAAVETLRVTTLRRWRTGRRVHLEPALRAGQALDGHLVLGHIDGTGRITRVARRGDSLLMTVHCGDRLAAWLMPKGSIAVDGVSLTVDEGPHTDRFTVNLIPYTLQWTRFLQARDGDEVNLEMDVLVKAARTGRTAEVFGALGETDGGPADDRTDRSVPSLAFILDRGFGRKGRS
jgi:riboflavin synthase alpha subunit